MWNKFYFDFHSVEKETEKAVLIAMPDDSIYPGYSFWFPKALCKESSGGWLLLSFPDDFNFVLRKGRKDKRELELSATEMIRAVRKEVVENV